MPVTEPKRVAYRAAAAAFRISVSGALIWWCLREVSLERALRGIERINISALAIALCVLLLQLLLTAWRWRLVCAALGQARPSPRNALRWSGLSLMLSQVLPSTVGGDAYRIGAFSRDAGVLPAVRTVVHDRLIGLMSLAVLAALSAGTALGIGGFSAAFVAMLVFSCGIVLALAAGTVIGRNIVQHAPNLAARRFGDELRAFRSVYRSPRIFLISLAIQLLTVLAVLVIHAGSGLEDAKAWQFILVTPGAMLASAMPISLGGWGVREGAMAIGFQALHTAPETPILVSAAYGITLVVAALFGIAFWALPRTGKKARP